MAMKREREDERDREGTRCLSEWSVVLVFLLGVWLVGLLLGVPVSVGRVRFSVSVQVFRHNDPAGRWLHYVCRVRTTVRSGLDPENGSWWVYMEYGKE